MALASASRFGVPPAASRVFLAARPLGARAVLVRRSSRSFSGLVAVPVVPASAWGAPLAGFCAAFAASLGVSVAVRRSASGALLPSVPCLPRSAPRRSVSVLRPLAAPARVAWVRRPAPVAVVAAPVRVAGVPSAWRVSVRGALRRRGFRLARRPLPAPVAVAWVFAPGRRSAALAGLLGRRAPLASIRAPRPRWARSLRPLFGRCAGVVSLSGVVARPAPAPVELPPAPLPPSGPRFPRRRFAPPVLVASCPACGSRVPSAFCGPSSFWLFCPVCGCSALLPGSAWLPAAGPVAVVPAPAQLALF